MGPKLGKTQVTFVLLVMKSIFSVVTVSACFGQGVDEGQVDTLVRWDQNGFLIFFDSKLCKFQEEHPISEGKHWWELK